VITLIPKIQLLEQRDCTSSRRYFDQHCYPQRGAFAARFVRAAHFLQNIFQFRSLLIPPMMTFNVAARFATETTALRASA
jgi:hypothetical protein